MNILKYTAEEYSLTQLLDELVVVFLKENSVFFVPNLDHSLFLWMKDEDIQRFEIITPDAFKTISLRSFFVEIFESLGVSIAFSGKNEFEKGVILESETQKMLDLGMSFDHFKMGQTIIRNESKENLNIFVENRHDISQFVATVAQYLRENIAIRNTKHFI